MLKKTPGIIALVLVLGCSSTSVLCVRYDFDTAFNTDISLSRFTLPDTTAIANTKYFKYYDPITLGQIAMKEVYRTGSDFFVTFDESDFHRLRRSLVQSLDKSQGFRQVHSDTSRTATPEDRPGLSLQIEFRSAGMRLEKIQQHLWGYVCFLDSHIIMTNNGETVWEEDVYVEESSPSSNRVKREVILSFLEEFGSRLALI